MEKKVEKDFFSHVRDKGVCVCACEGARVCVCLCRDFVLGSFL